MKWNQERREAFLQLTARGHDISKICRIVGIARKTFYRWCAQHPKFAELVEKAKAQGEVKLADIAWKQALGGDGAMIRFILSRRFGWSEKYHLDVKDVTPGRMVLVQKLAALPPEERAAVNIEESEESTIQ